MSAKRKLTPEQAYEIRLRYARKSERSSLKLIAEDFGVSGRAAKNIVNGVTYKDVPFPPPEAHRDKYTRLPFKFIAFAAEQYRPNNYFNGMRPLAKMLGVSTQQLSNAIWAHKLRLAQTDVKQYRPNNTLSNP